MTEITVGSVGVEVVPSVERFADTLRASLAPQAKSMGRDLGKSIGDAIAQSVKDTLRRELRDLPEAVVKVDTKQADSSVRELRDSIDRLRGKTVELNAEYGRALDTGRLFGRGLGGLKLIAGGLGDAIIKLTTGALSGLATGLQKMGWQAGATGLQSLSDGISGVAKQGWQGQLAILALIGAAVEIAPIVLPIIAVLAGGILGIVAALSLATLGIAAFGVVAFTVFNQVLGAAGAYQTALATQAKAQTAFQKLQIGAEFSLGFDKGNAKAPGAAAAALALAQKQGLGSKYLPNGLSQSQKAALAQAQANLATANAGVASQAKSLGPQGIAISNQWQGIQNQFAGIITQLKPAIFPVLAAGLRLVSTAMTYLGPIVKTVAPVVVGLLNEAGKALASPEAKAFAAYIAKAAPGVIKDIGEILGRLIAGLPGFIRVFTPFGKAILDWVRNAIGNFGKLWDSPNMQLFFKYIKDNAPNVLDFFKTVGKTLGIIIGFFIQLAPLGAAVLPIVTGLWKIFNFLLIPVLWAFKNLMQVTFDAILLGVQGVLLGIAQVAHIFHAPFADALTTAANNVGTFRKNFDNQMDIMTAAVTGKLQPAIDNLTAKKTISIAIDFNVLGQPYNPFTGKLFPAGSFGAPGAVSHSGGHRTGIVVPVLPGGHKTANGGLIHRAVGGLTPQIGTNRSDSIPAWLSAGEYVINAQATKQHLASLQAINSGGQVHGTKIDASFTVNGYGAEQVAGLLVTKERSLQLLYG